MLTPDDVIILRERAALYRDLGCPELAEAYRISADRGAEIPLPPSRQLPAPPLPDVRL